MSITNTEIVTGRQLENVGRENKIILVHLVWIVRHEPDSSCECKFSDNVLLLINGNVIILSHLFFRMLLHSWLFFICLRDLHLKFSLVNRCIS